jgi:hypothetical protein
LRDIKGKATQDRKFAEGINTDANSAEEMILALVEDAEKLLEVPPLVQTV